MGLAGGLSVYGFASGDPVNFSDPFGLCPSCGPPVPLPPGKGGGPNEWQNIGPAREGARDRWVPRDPIKTTEGGQPGGSWDDKRDHWDVSDGKGTTRRYLPDGTEVDHDNKPVDKPADKPAAEPGPVDRMVQAIRDFLNQPVPAWLPALPPLLPGIGLPPPPFVVPVP